MCTYYARQCTKLLGKSMMHNRLGIPQSYVLSSLMLLMRSWRLWSIIFAKTVLHPLITLWSWLQAPKTVPTPWTRLSVQMLCITSDWWCQSKYSCPSKHRHSSNEEVEWDNNSTYKYNRMSADNGLVPFRLHIDYMYARLSSGPGRAPRPGPGSASSPGVQASGGETRPN